MFPVTGHHPDHTLRIEGMYMAHQLSPKIIPITPWWSENIGNILLVELADFWERRVWQCPRPYKLGAGKIASIQNMLEQVKIKGNELDPKSESNPL